MKNTQIKKDKKLLKAACAIVFAMLFIAFAGMRYSVANANGDNSVATSCVEADCTGTYTNGICENGHYQPATHNDNGTADDTTDDYYEISNAGQLLWFAAKVNGGETSINGKLTDNVDASAIKAFGIGNGENAYGGTFDGNKKVLNLALEQTEQYAAPFSYVNGATIKNLIVDGTISTTQKFAASIIGRVQGGDVKIEKCISDVEITSSVEGDGTHGGLIANGGGGTITVTDCAFTGSIEGTSTKFCGGIIGYTSVTATIANSYVAATFNLVSEESGNTFARSGNKVTVNVSNCYYLNALSDAQRSGTTQMSEQSFALGEVTYLLNGGKTDGSQTWYQTCGAGLPSLSGNTVYRVYTTCKAEYSNDNDRSATPVHDYQNGFCTHDNTHYQPATLNDNGTLDDMTDDYYEISNAGQLYWFAALTNGTLDGVDANKSANARLTDDIVVNKDVVADGVLVGDVTEFMLWTPISNRGANDSNRYYGTFDGNNHTISGLYMKRTAERFGGFIGCVKDGTVKNLTIASSYFEGGSSYVGAITGFMFDTGTIENCIAKNCVVRGGKYIGGISGGCCGSIKRCGSEKCDIASTSTGDSDGRVGGICGLLGEGDKTATISDCYSTSKITAPQRGGGIAGMVQISSTIRNCYFFGHIECAADASQIGYVAKSEKSNNTVIDNCYYANDEMEGVVNKGSYGSVTNVEYKTAEEFASGEVAYLLNGKKSNGLWKQTLGIGGDATPDFVSEFVYPVLETCSSDTITGYSNDVQDEHHVYENGICTQTDGQKHYQPATLNDGVYEISNVGQLFWFAEYVSNGQTNCNGILTDNIDLQNYEWTAIGTADKPYGGVFDGNDKTVSELSIAATSGERGLFGAVNGATIKNLTVKGSIVISASGVQTIGGVIGRAYGKATIESVVSYVNISDQSEFATNANKYIGGVVGNADASTVKNCAYYGSVTMQTGEVCGGIVGTANTKTRILYCNNYGTVTFVGVAKHIGGVIGDMNGGSQVTYCVNYGDVTSGGHDCIGGVVAYANSQIVIENCANIGTVKSTGTQGGYIGGICGYINNNAVISLKNCFNYGKIISASGSNDHSGAIVGWCRKFDVNNSVNNYYLADSCAKASDTIVVNASVKTDIQFASGEVAMLLGSAWGQNVAKDAYPVLSGDSVLARYEFYGQAVNIGGDIAIKYYVMAFDVEFDLSKLSVEFTFHGKTKTVNGAFDAKTGLYVFALEGINPQSMGDNIKAVLSYDGTVKATKDNYSVEANLKNVLNSSDDQTVINLINGTLGYGAAAEEYFGYESLDGEYTVPETEIPQSAVTIGESFKEYSIVVGNMTFIKVKFALESGESVYFNGVDVTDKIVKDGDYYTFVTGGIAASDFGTVYTFAIKTSEEEKETLSVSVNDCLYLLKTSQSSSDKQKKLASALYNYGLRARICDHDCEGGTATCVSKAVCSICGESYGSYGEHNCSLHSDDETHYYACDNEGCDFKKDEAAHSDDNDDGKCDVCEKEIAA